MLPVLLFDNVIGYQRHLFGERRCEDVNRWCGDTNRLGYLCSAERLGGTERKKATNTGGPILVGPWSVLVLDALLSSVPG